MSKSDEFFDITGAADVPPAAAPRDPNVEVDFDVFGVGDAAADGPDAGAAIDITRDAGDFTETAILAQVEVPTGALDFELDGEPATAPLDADDDDLPEHPAPAAPASPAAAAPTPAPPPATSPAPGGGGAGLWIAVAAAVAALAAAAFFLR